MDKQLIARSLQARRREPGRPAPPDAACPRCGARPAMRLTAVQRRVYAALPAEMVMIESNQCWRHGCRARYPLTAGALARPARAA